MAKTKNKIKRWFKKKFVEREPLFQTEAGWHPASGKWGILGQTKASKQAGQASSQISKTLADVEGRKEGVEDYFNALRGFQQREEGFASAGNQLQRDANQVGYLTSMENFLMDSYNIGFKSDSTASKRNFASADPMTQFIKESRRRGISASQDQQNIKDKSFALGIGKQSLDAERARAKLDMDEIKQIQEIEDLLTELRMEKTRYS